VPGINHQGSIVFVEREGSKLACVILCRVFYYSLVLPRVGLIITFGYLINPDHHAGRTF
jgi:hypothetical protein